MVKQCTRQVANHTHKIEPEQVRSEWSDAILSLAQGETVIAARLRTIAMFSTVTNLTLL